mmetsp:Transcript_11280/g.20558  ORF Transcript_11280/g.20558 Transcript_11280/m.20558 type:complete len:149 (+) Transcript_11280:376-822(+)
MGSHFCPCLVLVFRLQEQNCQASQECLHKESATNSEVTQIIERSNCHLRRDTFQSRRGMPWRVFCKALWSGIIARIEPKSGRALHTTKNTLSTRKPKSSSGVKRRNESTTDLSRNAKQYDRDRIEVSCKFLQYTCRTILAVFDFCIII